MKNYVLKVSTKVVLDHCLPQTLETQDRIMKTSLKLEFLIVLLFPIITCVLVYIAVVTLEESSKVIVTNEKYEFAATSQDIDKVKRLLLITLKELERTNKSEVELHYILIRYLVAVTFLSSAFTISIYICCRKLVSNKSVKQTD